VNGTVCFYDRDIVHYFTFTNSATQYYEVKLTKFSLILDSQKSRNNVATNSVLQISAEELDFVRVKNGGLGLIFFQTSSRNIEEVLLKKVLFSNTKWNQILRRFIPE
jgi:hypothetical protein